MGIEQALPRMTPQNVINYWMTGASLDEHMVAQGVPGSFFVA